MNEKLNGVVLVIVAVVLLAVTSIQGSRINQLSAEVTQLEQQTASISTEIANLSSERLITRVVKIYDDGEGSRNTLSLTPQGWVEFMREYPGYGSCFSNIDFEDLFTFTEVEIEYPEEVVDFFEKEKTSFAVWSTPEGYESLHGGDFIMCYHEYRDGIEILFSNQEDDLQVKYEFTGAQHAKEVHIDGTGKYYLVFEDKDSNLMAICPRDDMKAYKLTALTATE